jgi:hypothetical protein
MIYYITNCLLFKFHTTLCFEANVKSLVYVEIIKLRLHHFQRRSSSGLVQQHGIGAGPTFNPGQDRLDPGFLLNPGY